MMRTAAILLVATALAAAATGCGGEPETFDARLAEAGAAFRGRDYAAAGDLFGSISEDALAAGDTTAYVEACAMRARSDLAVAKKEEGREWLALAQSRADVSDPRAWTSYLGARGRFEWQDGEPEAASATFREMFDYCSEREMWEGAVDAAHMVAITGPPGERYDWALRGIDMAERGGMEGWLGPLWNNLGWEYQDAGRYEEALDALEKAREYHSRGSGEIPRLIADYSVAHVERMLGRLGEAEAGMSAVHEWAERLHEQGNAEAVEWLGMSRWELGEIALARGRRSEAVGLLGAALEELEAAGMPDWDPEGWAERRKTLADLR